VRCSRRRHGARHGRDGHGKGSRRPRSAPAVAPASGALRSRGLHIAFGVRDRERALRARARRVHGSRHASVRSIRAGGPRDDLPRRDRRAAASAPGHPAEGAPGSRVRARRRCDHAIDAGANRGRDEPRSAQRSRIGSLPRRPVLSAACPAPRASAAAGSSPRRARTRPRPSRANRPASAPRESSARRGVACAFVGPSLARKRPRARERGRETRDPLHGSSGHAPRSRVGSRPVPGSVRAEHRHSRRLESVRAARRGVHRGRPARVPRRRGARGAQARCPSQHVAALDRQAGAGVSGDRGR